MPPERLQRRDMVRVGRLLYERQLLVAAEGNLSCRLSGETYLVTPTGLCKGMLQEDELLVLDRHGGVRGRKLGLLPRASSEWLLHREIYALRPDVQAICHAHPAWATAWAAARRPLPSGVLTEVAVTIGEVPLAPFALPGTAEVAASIRNLIVDHDAVLLANHGVVTVGASLQDAYFALETVERLAQVAALSGVLGGTVPLTPEQIAAVRGAVAKSPAE